MNTKVSQFGQCDHVSRLNFPLNTPFTGNKVNEKIPRKKPGDKRMNSEKEKITDSLNIDKMENKKTKSREKAVERAEQKYEKYISLICDVVCERDRRKKIQLSEKCFALYDSLLDINVERNTKEYFREIADHFGKFLLYIQANKQIDWIQYYQDSFDDTSDEYDEEKIEY